MTINDDDRDGIGANNVQVVEDDDSSHVGGDAEDDDDFGGKKKRREEIAKQESRMVFCLRVLVLVVLLASALAVVVSVYSYMSNAEHQEFEDQFDSDATKVLEAVGRTLDQTLGSTDAFVLQLLQYAKHSGHVWPFVTVPGFPQQAGKLLKLSKAFFCSVGLFVEPEQREQWESYAQNNTFWIDETIQVQAQDNRMRGIPDGNFSSFTAADYTLHPRIFGFRGPMTEPTPYRNNFNAQWQHYPIQTYADALPSNWDNWVVPSAAAAITDALEDPHQPRIAIAPASNIVPPNATDMQKGMVQSIQGWAQQYIPPQANATEPFLSIWVPMLDSATDSIQMELKDEEPPPKAVGFFIYWFFWSGMIRGILPTSSNGILVVITNPCGPSFTYRLDGPQETYLGVGDRHDPKYDYLGQSQTFADVMEITQQSEEGSSYVGIPLSKTHCTHTIHVYPSQDMEEDHLTNGPILFTLVAALIFLFTSFVFISYDCTVARRQRIVMERALASGAIVSSLFPEKEFVHNAADHGGSACAKSSKPIADLFHDTTIFFADLAGFTAWSAKRTPVEVFELLEALYGRFDKIAARRNVFKVETIGDCYVAVTGIPEPQAQHATIMCRFARDVMSEMNLLTRELADSLGEDTKDLEMRVGLHSGSTTAGVLRGEKGRFQLFGDTVNTASRMESNGIRGRIHVSQATADALIQSGKEHWLTQREDKIVAKGKGEMQTYFVQISPGTAKTGQSCTTGSVFSSVISDSPGSAIVVDMEDQDDPNVSNIVSV